MVADQRGTPAPCHKKPSNWPQTMPNLKAGMTLNQALVERTCRFRDDAQSHLELAVHLYQQKGNLAAATLAESTSPT